MKNYYEQMVSTIKTIAIGAIKSSWFARLYVGTVATTSPLSIVITDITGGTQTITSKYLLVSSLCRKKIISNTHYHIYQDNDNDTNDGEGATGGHSNPQIDAHTSNEVPNNFTYKGHTISSPPNIILWDDLQIGEKVLVLRLNKGQIYWVLDRGE